MKLLYFDCGMGADLLEIAGALLDLFEDREKMIEQLNDITPPEVCFSYQIVNGFGIELKVSFPDSSDDSQDCRMIPEKSIPFAERSIWDEISVPDKVKKDVSAIMIMAEMAGDTFGETSGNQIAFFYQILACSYMIYQLRPEIMISSPVNVGGGILEKDQKLLSIPTPATMSLLKEIPVCQGTVKGERCNLYSAAFLIHFVDEYENMPVMMVQKCGYGVNYEADSGKMMTIYQAGMQKAVQDTYCKDQITLIHANLDDMTGEAIGFAQEMLWQSGALDVYTTAINMKKNRPAVMLSCICKPEEKDKCIDTFLKYTTTLGVRIENMDRRVLKRHFETRETEAGTIHVKTATHKETRKWKAEYDDIRKIAIERGIPLREAERFLNF